MGFKSIPTRYIFSILTFFGFIFNYMLRININMAIVTMVNHTALALDDSSANQTNLSALQNGPFLWDSIARNQIIGSFYWGYIITQIPGGRLAELIGGKRVLTVAMTGTALLTLLIPLAAKLGNPSGYPYLLVTIRMAMGLFEGVTVPCMTAMLAKWAPAQERSVMTTFTFSGIKVGIVISYQMVGVIVNNLGWEYVFYIQGSACFLWVAVWCWYSSDTPATHPSISNQEKEYISSQLPITNSQRLSFPVRHVLRSWPFWAILVANFANNWGLQLVMSQLPQYFSEVFHKKLAENALWNSIPYVCNFVFSLAVAKLADFLIKTSVVSKGNVRKLCNTVGLGGAGLCLLIILLCNTPDNKQETVTKVMFTLGVSCLGAVLSGFLTNIQDIAPNFAGTILGITNTLGSICGWVAPMVSGFIVNEDPSDVTKWQSVWITAVAIMMVGATFFVIFAKGETQAWNNLELNKEGREEEEEKTSPI